MGKEADGLIGEVPTAMPTPEAPTPEAQAWVDRFTKIWGSQPQAGSTGLQRRQGLGCGR